MTLYHTLWLIPAYFLFRWIYKGIKLFRESKRNYEEDEL